MKNIIPPDTKYIPLTQQKWCCVPTCIQMVMLRHNLPLLPAELIGYYLGLVVPQEAKKFFWHARTGSKPPAGFGTQTSKPRFNPNKAFKKLNIPLTMTKKLIDKFPDLKSFHQYLDSVKNSDKDILVCFDHPTLTDLQQKEHWGHVCVLDQVDIDKNQIRIIDPSQLSIKWLTVKIPKMYKAMVIHTPKNSGGLWELRLLNTTMN